MATGTELFTDALIQLGVYQQGEPLSAGDQQLCRRIFNRMMGRWATQSLFAFYTGHQEFAFGVSQQVYTIGLVGANFIAPRPLRIEAANLVLANSTPNVYIPLYVANVQQRENEPIPALSSTLPIYLYYEATNPLGKLYPWPFPIDVTNKLDLWTWNRLTEIAEGSENTQYDLPPGYEAAIVDSLAEYLGPAFGVSITDDLRSQARQSRAAIKGLNSSAPPISTRDFGMPRSGAPRNTYNWRTGSNIPT